MCLCTEAYYFEKWDEKYLKQGDAKQLNDWVAEPHKKNWSIYQNHILTLTAFWKLHNIK